MIDFHCHSPREGDRLNSDGEMSCVISRGVHENDRCRQFAKRYGLFPALFAQPGTSSWKQVCESVSKGEALAYLHPYRVPLENRSHYLTLLHETRRAQMPLVIHLSRHGLEQMPAEDAQSWIEYIRAETENVPLIISHAGGENCRVAIRASSQWPNIFFDLSRWEDTARRSEFKSDLELLRALRQVVTPSRLLFGSDCVWPRGEVVWKRLLQALRAIGDSIEVGEMLDNNARNVLAQVAQLGAAMPLR